MAVLFLPSSLVTASSPVVPVCTPTFSFFRSPNFATLLLSFTAINCAASKYGSLKSIVCLRSSVMVTAETTMSRSPWPSALKMPSQGVLTNFTSKPALAAMAFTTSMSKPTISPFSFWLSNGA